MPQYLGNGTVITITGASGSTITLGNVLSIEGAEPEFETVDATLLTSTVAYRSYLKGDGDPGTVTIQVAYDNRDSGQIALNELMARSPAASTISDFTITYNTTNLDVDSFSGYVVGRGRTIERNGMVQGSVTVKLSSDPGYATST